MCAAPTSSLLAAAAARAENVTTPLQHGDRVSFGSRHVQVGSTPGHTDGCITFVLDDQSMAFTGDALLMRSLGRSQSVQDGEQAR